MQKKKKDGLSRPPTSSFVLGNYVITSLLNSAGGGGAYLFLGQEISTSENVVIKMVKKDNTPAGAKVLRQLKKEALVMACLQQNNNNKKQENNNSYTKSYSKENNRIIPLLHVFEDSQRYCVVMPLAEGGDLFDYISHRKGLDRDEAWRIFAQIVEGLSYAHSRGFIHRDIKPENIFLDWEGNVLIGDWGFGTHWSSFHPKIRSCGSPNYVAGEVLREAPYIGPELDVFSLGVVFYACLTGKLPFGNGDHPLHVKRVKKGQWMDDPTLTNSERILLDAMFHPHPLFRATLFDIRNAIKERS